MSDPKDASYLDDYRPARLTARDAEDLAVISALLQDSVAVSTEMAFLKKNHRFAFIVNRYRWEEPDAEERVRAGVHFDQVLAARSKGVDLGGPAQPISILAVTFEPTQGADPEAPAAGGMVHIQCAGEAEIMLEVDALEGQLRDMTLPWPAKGRPEHSDDPPV